MLKRRNATLRSKAEAKGRTLLGVYGRIVAEAKGLTSLQSFERAFEVLCTMVGPEVCVRLSWGERVMGRGQLRQHGQPALFQGGGAAGWYGCDIEPDQTVQGAWLALADKVCGAHHTSPQRSA